MKNSSCIFIASDFVMDPALDATADTLRARGHHVIRGSRAIPGQKTAFSLPVDASASLDQLDVIVMTSRVTLDPTLLDGMTKLRGIVFPSIGTDTINLADATARGLIVANGATPENFQSMAEATVMLMLNLFYDLRGTERILQEHRPRPTMLSARMLRGKTVGLIGLGRIARGVAQRLHGWDVDIVAVSPRTRRDDVPAGVRLVDLDELLRTSDIVSLHTTLTDETSRLIGAAQLSLMKSNAFLINTARGGCVDEHALAQALRNRTIAGAALDTFSIEPLPAVSPLRTLDNVILTPHMAGHTQELFESFAPACVHNVESILNGDVPPFVCNPHAVTPWKARLKALTELQSQT